ncbi:MAG: hypothetical protein FWH01_03240 [Oscillospiraceae bacterium]|nr:hypothetical protein [Oscillospiraceae bacterium]
MSKNHIILSTSYRNETVERLKVELKRTRHRLLYLLPWEMSSLLTDYSKCKSRKDTYQWLNNTVQQIIDSVPSRSEERFNSWVQERVKCPLCNSAPNSPYYYDGFTLPEGLRRHLVGYGNIQQCLFTETAEKLALDYWNEKFSEMETKIEIQKQQDLRVRRQNESLFKITPFEEVLYDEHLWGKIPRNEDQLNWAEHRLSELGFLKITEERRISWLDEYENHVVYADIRGNGRIDFSVWKKPLPKRTTNPNKYRVLSFYFLDTWKNNLKQKYEAQLTKF